MASDAAPGLPEPAAAGYHLYSLAGSPPIHAGVLARRRTGEPLDPASRQDRRGAEAERSGGGRSALQPPLAPGYRGAGGMDRGLKAWRADTPGCSRLVHLNNAG